MKKTYLSLIIIFFYTLTSNFSFGQDAQPISFQGITLEMTNNVSDFSWSQLSQSQVLTSGYYMIIQFESTPNQSVQNAFKAQQVELKDYLSNSSYFAFIPTTLSKSFLEDSGVISIVQAPKEFKMSSKIRNGEIGEWAKEGSNVLINLSFHKNFNLNELIAELTTVTGASIKQQFKGSNMVVVSVPFENRIKLAQLRTVKWIELIPEPDVKDDDRGQSLHRSSNLDTQTLTGRNYTGEGIGVMVRDDGIVGPHIDFHGRIDNSRATGDSPNNDHGIGSISGSFGLHDELAIVDDGRFPVFLFKIADTTIVILRIGIINKVGETNQGRVKAVGKLDVFKQGPIVHPRGDIIIKIFLGEIAQGNLREDAAHIPYGKFSALVIDGFDNFPT